MASVGFAGSTNGRPKRAARALRFSSSSSAVGFGVLVTGTSAASGVYIAVGALDDRSVRVCMQGGGARAPTSGAADGVGLMPGRVAAEGCDCVL